MIVDGYVTEIRLDGEFSDAVRWQNFAVNKLRDVLRARTLTQGYMNLGDVKMRYFINHTSKLAKVWVEAGRQYMESCYQDMRSSTLTAADFYRPAIVSKNSIAAGLPDSPRNAGKNRLLADGDNSWACGQRSLKTAVSTTVGETNTPVEFVSGEPEFCRPDAITNMKHCRMLVPPSMYTGLMRKYVQALYGTRRRDYSWRPNPNGVAGYLIVSSKPDADYSSATSGTAPESAVHMYNTDQSSGILYDETSGHHVLITAGVTAVAYRRMSVVTPVDKRKFETDAEHIRYLSALSPSRTLGIVEVDMTSAIGWYFPAYSWKFNSTGSRAIGCMFYDEFDEFGNPMGFKTRVATLDFTYANGVLSALFTAGNETVYAPSTLYSFTVPAITQSGDGMKHVWQRFDGPTGTTGTAPVYAYFDSDDAEIVASVEFGGDKNTLTTPAASSGVSNDPSLLFGGEGPPVDGGTLAVSGLATPEVVNSGTYGVQAAEVSYTGSSSVTAGATVEIERSVTCGPLIYPPVPAAWNPNFWSPGFDVSVSDWNRYEAYYNAVWSGPGSEDTKKARTTIGTAWASGSPDLGGSAASASQTVTIADSANESMMLAVPWYDAAAIVAGKLTTRTSNGVVKYTSSVYANNSAWYFQTLEGGFKCASTWARFGAYGFSWQQNSGNTPSYEAAAEFRILGSRFQCTYSVRTGETGAVWNALQNLFHPRTVPNLEVPNKIYVKSASMSEDHAYRVSDTLGVSGVFAEWPHNEFTSPAGVT